MNTLLIPFICAMLAATAVIVPLSYLGRQVGLVDTPTDRKRHTGLVPLVGGSALVVCILAWMPLFGASSNAGLAILAFCVPALALGLADDKLDLSARLRFVIQLFIGAGLVWFFDVRIDGLDGIWSSTPIVLGTALSAAFTIVCVTGVLNATNMTDGVDGLLGSVACLSLGVMATLAFIHGRVDESVVALIVAGALVGYLCFNLGLFGLRRKVFLGDSGSLVVGLVLVVLLIELSRGENPAFSPTAAGWLLGLPLLDTVTVMTRRIMRGVSPFSAGRDHLHHQLLDSGYTPRETLMRLVTLHVLMLIVGALVDISSVPPYVFFWAFVALTLVHFFLTPRLGDHPRKRAAPEADVTAAETSRKPEPATSEPARQRMPIDADKIVSSAQ